MTIIDYSAFAFAAPLTTVPVYRAFDEGETDLGGSGGVLLPHSRARRIAALKNK